ncbi:MAG: hypothetical protein JSS30_06600 [Verrucomicrobia bacterium]|nr:hypothetical protein [Verrucomicrobiota bacterium]
MVAEVGRTPPFPPREPEDLFQHLAAALRTHLGDFCGEVEEIMKNPHLADNESTLRNLAQSINNLENLSNQAASLNDS